MLERGGKGDGKLLTISISAFSFGSKQITVNEIVAWSVSRRTARLTKVLRIEIVVIVDESNFIVRIVLQNNEDHQRLRDRGALVPARYLDLLLEFEEVRTLTMSLDVVQKYFLLDHLRVILLCHIFVDTDLHRLLGGRRDEYGMDTIRQICVETRKKREVLTRHERFS